MPPLSNARTIYQKGEQDNDRLSEQHPSKAGNHHGKRNYTQGGALAVVSVYSFGKVTLLQGDLGDGKSKLMLSLAALLSKGAPLPFADEDESGEPMTVIYQTTEDDADDTVVPRFNSAGGDGDRLIFIKEDEKSLTFGDDRICEAVEKYNAKLLSLDPMSSYIGDICSMNNANETRAEFNHLIAVAKDTGCAIVIIAHMNKAKDTPYQRLYRHCRCSEKYSCCHPHGKQADPRRALSGAGQEQSCTDGVGYSL